VAHDDEPTEAQWKYVRGMQHSLRLNDALLDNHCVATYGKRFYDLTRGETSDLIDAMKEWRQIPAELQRAAGQQELPL
jgi:hypothetical protein